MTLKLLVPRLWKQLIVVTVYFVPAAFQWAKKTYGINELAQGKCAEILSALPALAGSQTTGLRIGLFATFVGLGPPELKALKAAHLDFYLSVLSSLPLGKHTQVAQQI